MIHTDLTLDQEEALCLVAARSLAASRVALDAVNGSSVDPEHVAYTIYESLMALHRGFPDEVDEQAVRTIIFHKGHGAALLRKAANDRYPDGAA